MIANGNYKRREIAYTSEFMGDYKPYYEHIDELFDELYQRAECCDYDCDWENNRKGVYQDNYYIERNGNEYLIQIDIVTDTATLYEIKAKEEEK